MMLKKYKWKLLITTLITLIPMLIGCILWKRLPDIMPTHFGFEGTADGWSSKTFAVFGLPLLMAALHVFAIVITTIDPKHKNIGSKAFGIVFWIIPVTSLLLCALTYAMALGASFDIRFYVCLFVGILFVVMGNFLPKAKQNYTYGFKLPWTLNDAENWNRTHRVAGWCMVTCGIIFIIASFFVSTVILIVVFAVAVPVAVLIPSIYSYLLYKKTHQDEQEDE